MASSRKARALAADDLLLVNRNGVDHKAKAELLISNDGKLTIKDSGGGVLGEFTADQASDTEVTLPKVDYNEIDNKPDIIDLIDKSAGDGAINVEAGAGLTATGQNATANQKGDTTRTLAAKVGDGITIDGSGGISIDPNFNLDGNVTAPNDGKVTIQDSNGSDVGEFTVNQAGDTTITLPAVQVPDSIHPKGFINVADPAPADPLHGDLYIQNTNGAGAVTADASFGPGITGQVEEGVFVMFGVDDLWHAGGDALNTQIQSDWNESDVTAPAYIQNKPDLQDEVDAAAGDGAINVEAGVGLIATGQNATANQKGDTTRTLAVKAGDGISIDGDGSIIIDPSFDLNGNVTPPNDGTLILLDSDGFAVGMFTADQAGDTTVTLPKGFSGDYNDLTNKPAAPVINDGKLNLQDPTGATKVVFSANQAGDQDAVVYMKDSYIQNLPTLS